MILLCSPPSFDPAPVARALAGSSLAVRCQDLSLRDWSLPEGVTRAVMILQDPHILSAGEAVDKLRGKLPAAIPLGVCGPRYHGADREVLISCGAAAVVTPRDSSAASVAERILAELIVAGEVQPAGLGALCGATREMQALYQQIETLAPLREPVLILGETGCGKELVARELHQRSGRRGQILSLNCAEFAGEILESELFGHERGAFSGAASRRQGLLVEAGSGTVFLDEIGELTLAAQAKLLRVVEEKKVRPVGGNSWVEVEARMVFATNLNLAQGVREKTFRHDLHERLRGFTLTLPPLRERRADLPLLAHHFVAEYNRDYPGERTVPPAALDALFRHDWPGNVRELRSAVRKAAAFAASGRGPISELHLLEVVKRRDPTPHSFFFDPASETWREVHDRLRSRYFRAVLAQTSGQKEAAAQRAGMSRSQFYEVLRQLEPDDAES